MSALALIAVLAAGCHGGGARSAGPPRHRALPTAPSRVRLERPLTAEARRGRRLFRHGTCAACHAFGPARTYGTIGPRLDGLATFARRAGLPLPAFVRQSIAHPDAYVQPGFPPLMQGQERLLRPRQLDALVAFLLQGLARGR